MLHYSPIGQMYGSLTEDSPRIIGNLITSDCIVKKIAGYTGLPWRIRMGTVHAYQCYPPLPP